MKKYVSKWLFAIWYQGSYFAFVLFPLSIIYQAIVSIRRFLYRKGLFTSHEIKVPVIVVGNISVGGTGKTPFVIWLTAFLKQAGFKPGIITRGYQGKAEQWPLPVTIDTDPELVGDEAVLLAQHCSCPISVGPSRVASARQLLENNDCDIIISDDGMQHYALKRDIEIAVIDGQRRFGNGCLLPAGPLREPIKRLANVDLVVCNGGEQKANEFFMKLEGNNAVNLKTAQHKPLKDFKGQPCHALAGIGNPVRFFDMLKATGLDCRTHLFADHHPFQQQDINFDDFLPVLMTEKDAVKCRSFAQNRHWYVPVAAKMDEKFIQQLTQRVLALKNDK